VKGGGGSRGIGGSAHGRMGGGASSWTLHNNMRGVQNLFRSSQTPDQLQSGHYSESSSFLSVIFLVQVFQQHVILISVLLISSCQKKARAVGLDIHW
jgi:hypothetical protein